MQKEPPPIFWRQVCGDCEKAHQGVRTCEIYPEGIPEVYRWKFQGPKNPEDKTPDCPDFEQEKDPGRWGSQEWFDLIEEVMGPKPE